MRPAYVAAVAPVPGPAPHPLTFPHPLESHMPEQPSLSRRRALQALTGATLLPLAASFLDKTSVAQAAGADRSGGGERDDSPRGSTRIGAGRPVQYAFNGMAAPSLADPAQMATTYVASTLTRKVRAHQTQTFSLGYETFFLTGADVPRTGGGTILAGGYLRHPQPADR